MISSSAKTSSAAARAAGDPAIISAIAVNKWYGPFHALKSCDLEVVRGEVVVICGPSGSGKSTLIKCINGLEDYQEGTITFDGIVVGAPTTDMPRLRSKVGMVFQHFELFPHLDVTENIVLAQRKVLGRDRKTSIERAHDLLARINLADQSSKYPNELSGGQQQRVAIARALAMDPVAMLFDEPTSSLDPEMIGEVLEVMVALARDGMTMICVTHEMGFASNVADRIVFMDGGAIVEVATPSEFFTATKTTRAKQFLQKVLHPIQADRIDRPNSSSGEPIGNGD